MPEPPTVQRWNPDQYDRAVRFVSDLGMPVMSLLAPRPGERILDLGCGDGALTGKLVDAGCTVVGVDASPEMVEAACRRGLDARIMDGHALDFESEFDGIFSNAALHWMAAPRRVIAGVARALKPGGRFVGEFGGRGNVAKVVSALKTTLERHGLEVRNPWFFPDSECYRTLLEQGGFQVQTIELIPRPTPLPGGIGDWLDIMAGSFFGAAPEDDRDILKEEVIDALAPVLRDGDGVWHVDYVRLRFHSTLGRPVFQDQDNVETG